MLEPVVEDWHTLMCFLSVSYLLQQKIAKLNASHILMCYKYYRSTDIFFCVAAVHMHSLKSIIMTQLTLFSDSSCDHGTLGQLFSVIKHLPAIKKPKENMHACTDALFTGSFLAAACKELGIEVETKTQYSLTRIEKMWNYKRKLGFIVQVSMKVVEK